MSMNDHHVREVNGEVVISTAVVLHAALAGAYGPENMTTDERVSSTRMAEALLAAAFDGGFTQSDILRTLVSTNSQRELQRQLVMEADRAIGSDRFMGVLRGLGVGLVPFAQQSGGAK